MRISVFTTFLFLWVTQDCVSGFNTRRPVDLLAAALGDSLTLKCTYDCSSGFVRGCWRKASENSGCYNISRKSNFCTVSLHLSNVSTGDVETNYTCFTVDTGDVHLPQRIERVVLLRLKAPTTAPTWTSTPAPETKNASLPVQPKDSSGGEFIGMKILAPVTVAVVLLLAALAVYLCVKASREGWLGKGSGIPGKDAASRSSSALPPQTGLSPVKAQGERVKLRIPTPDNESDIEVPYADIMITIRGVSTPELTQLSHSTPGDEKEWWGGGSRSLLQASCSADRLHVPQPREVSRKMSSNSEYAIITYS